MPTYFDFQARYFGSLIPFYRHVSVTFAPASISFRIRTICASVNFNVFTRGAFV